MSNQLTSESIQMLITAVCTHDRPLSEIEAERLLNAIARVQSGVPTGVPTNVEPKEFSPKTKFQVSNFEPNLKGDEGNL